MAELLGLFASLFCLSLPLTMIAWTFALLGVGKLRNPAIQPPEFRLISQYIGVSEQTPDKLAIANAIIFGGLGYVAPILGPFTRPFDPLVWLAVLAFFLVDALWLRRVKSAIVRSQT